jgi:hypothetical protein
MTVLPEYPDRQKVHRAFHTKRDDAEPSLRELLDDPVLLALMTRDRVSRRQLETLIGRIRHRLGFDAMPGFEATLFAECRAA